MKKWILILMALVLTLGMTGVAGAGSVTLSGTVVCIREETVLAQSGGEIESVAVHVGDAVRAGDTLATLRTRKVYALEDGTVYFYGSVGDDAADVEARYGAVACIQPDQIHALSASTRSAYNAEANKILQPYEEVYLRGSKDKKKTGTGRILVVSSGSFTVEILSGTFEADDSVTVYRDAAYAASSVIGKGTIALNGLTAYTGTGILVRFCVPSGTHVQRGDVLFETLEGSYLARQEDLNLITAPADGVIASCTLSPGSSIASGSAVATLYTDAGMRIEASVRESDLQLFQVGGTVTAHFTYAFGEDLTMPGTIERISRIGSENTADPDSEESWYSILIIPSDPGQLSYGMHAEVTTADTPAE